MYALISSTENVLDPNTQEVLGWRVAEVVEQPFEVYKTLFFIPCANDVVPDEVYYDQADQQIKQIPPYIPPDPVTTQDQPATSGTQEV